MDAPAGSGAKLYIAVDAGSGEIAAHALTPSNTDDAAHAAGLLRSVEGSVASVVADGAYDSDAVYQAVTRQQDQSPDVIVPPRASAVPSSDELAAQTPRDRHIRLSAQQGRMAWQRYKQLVGPKLRAGTLTGQQGEAALAVAVLNRMIRTAKPVCSRQS